MMYRARRSFVDPHTGRVFLRGKPYLADDERHADYLEKHGLIEKASAERTAGVNASSEQPKRRKRGGNHGAAG